MHTLLRVYAGDYMLALRAVSAAVGACGPVDGRHVFVTVASLYNLVGAGGDGLGDPHVQVAGPSGIEYQGGVFAGELAEKLVGKSSSTIMEPLIWA